MLLDRSSITILSSPRDETAHDKLCCLIHTVLGSRCSSQILLFYFMCPHGPGCLETEKFVAEFFVSMVHFQLTMESIHS